MCAPCAPCFFFLAGWSSEALPAKAGSVIRTRAALFRRVGVDGFRDAGMIQGEADRPKRKSGTAGEARSSRRRPRPPSAPALFGRGARRKALRLRPSSGEVPARRSVPSRDGRRVGLGARAGRGSRCGLPALGLALIARWPRSPPAPSRSPSRLPRSPLALPSLSLLRPAVLPRPLRRVRVWGGMRRRVRLARAG